MSSNPSWRLRQPKKKQSEARLSLIFAEPHSSPPRASAADSLDTVQSKASPSPDRSPQASLRRSPSVASTLASPTSSPMPQSATRGSPSGSSKRQKLSHDPRISQPPAPEQPATEAPSPPGDSAVLAASDASQEPAPPLLHPTAQQPKQSWFAFKKSSNIPEPTNAPTDPKPPPPAPEPARESAPEAVTHPAPVDAPSAVQDIAAAPANNTSVPVARSAESTTSILSGTSKKRGGWLGFGAKSNADAADGSAEQPTQPPLTTSPEQTPKPNDARPLAPVTPPPTPPRRDPSPPRTEAITIALPKSDNDDASSSRRGWFGSLGRHATNSSITSLPDSIDSHAPTPDRVGSPPPPPLKAVMVPVQQTVTTMNSSAPRYTLSIPLLGRSKVPLEAIAKVEKEKHSKAGPEVMEVDFASTDETATTSAPPAIMPAPDAPELPPPADGNEITARAARQESSWISYIWSSAPPPATQSLPASPAAPVAELPPSPAASNPELPPLRDASSDTANRTATTQSAWYTPWSWSSAPSEDATPTTEPEAPVVVEQAPSTRPQSPEPDPTVEENPLLRTAEQRASWVTYFTGRGRAPTAKKMYDENGGVEIMDLEEDAPAPADTTQTAASAQPIALSKPPKGKGKAAMRNAVATSATEPPSGKPPAQPITDSASVKHKVSAATIVPRPASPAPSRKGAKAPAAPRAPNLVLPTFDDTFKSGPRLAPPPAPSTLRRTLGMVRDSLFAHDDPAKGGLGFDVPHYRKGDRKWARQLPRAWSVLNGGKGANDIQGLLQGCKRVVIFGVHGWFPGAIMRTVLGEPTGTSSKFANMMEAAVQQFMDQHGHRLDKVTTMPLEGEGTIDRRVDKLYQNLMAREEWVEDLHLADVIFVATHSQGSVASTHLLWRLIQEGHIRLAPEESGRLPSIPGMPSWTGAQRVCCLALCGIHLGPLTYLHQSSIVQPYLQYFESAAATELFEFQDTNSAVSKRYFEVLKEVLSHGVRFVYCASLDDQVVPIYSGTFASISHPLILRSLYIDGDAYNSSDFLSNLLILLLRLRNAGIDDAGLIALLSEATAGSLSGVGHSSAYEELGTYSLAVRFLFEASGVLHGPAELQVDHFSPRAPRNDYEIPWALRHILADPRVGELFGQQFIELRTAFDDWQPKTTALKDLRRKLEPIRRLPASRL